MTTPVPLAALVLAGGRSTRMQRDKAALEFAGESQLARAVRLVSEQTAETFVSVRADQRHEPERARWPQIVDRLADRGPAAGILAALEQRPDRAWLVVAVDLPLLDAATLAQLVRSRDPAALATAYRAADSGLPEPLCAIWEPRCREPLATYLDSGRDCPRKFLLTHCATLIDLRAPEALANVNTPAEYASARERATRGAA